MIKNKHNHNYFLANFAKCFDRQCKTVNNEGNVTTESQSKARKCKAKIENEDCSVKSKTTH